MLSRHAMYFLEITGDQDSLTSDAGKSCDFRLIPSVRLQLSLIRSCHVSI